MIFAFTMLDFPGHSPRFHSENDLPSWLVSKEMRWFYDTYVFTLEVGESVETDFQMITRVE